MTANAHQSVPVARLRALITLLFPDDITPLAKRVLTTLCEEYEEVRDD